MVGYDIIKVPKDKEFTLWKNNFQFMFIAITNTTNYFFLTIAQVKQLIRQDKTITHCGCWLDDEGYDYTVGEGWTYYYKADSDADDINNYEGNWCLQIRVPAIEW